MQITNTVLWVSAELSYPLYLLNSDKRAHQVENQR